VPDPTCGGLASCFYSVKPLSLSVTRAAKQFDHRQGVRLTEQALAGMAAHSATVADRQRVTNL